VGARGCIHEAAICRQEEEEKKGKTAASGSSQRHAVIESAKRSHDRYRWSWRITGGIMSKPEGVRRMQVTPFAYLHMPLTGVKPALGPTVLFSAIVSGRKGYKSVFSGAHPATDLASSHNMWRTGAFWTWWRGFLENQKINKKEKRVVLVFFLGSVFLVVFGNLFGKKKKKKKIKNLGTAPPFFFAGGENRRPIPGWGHGKGKPESGFPYSGRIHLLLHFLSLIIQLRPRLWSARFSYRAISKGPPEPLFFPPATPNFRATAPPARGAAAQKALGPDGLGAPTTAAWGPATGSKVSTLARSARRSSNPALNVHGVAYGFLARFENMWKRMNILVWFLLFRLRRAFGRRYYRLGGQRHCPATPFSAERKDQNNTQPFPRNCFF